MSKKNIYLQLLVATVLAATSPFPSAAQGNKQQFEIEQIVPPLFGLYKKSLNCGGVYIRGSRNVNDRSLSESCDRLNSMLVHQEIARKNLLQHGVELHLIAANEMLSSLPEHQLPDQQTAPQNSSDVYGVCYEKEQAGRDMTDQCTRQLAVSIMLYGFDAEMRKHIQQQYIDSKRRGFSVDAMSPQAYWAQLTATYLEMQSAKSEKHTMTFDPDSLAFARRVYSGLERPRAVEAIRARSVSKLALSKVNNMPASVQFVNNSSKSFQLLWMDSEGKLHAVAELGPYNRIVQDTALNQVWLIEDRRGMAVDRILVEDSLCEYIVAD